MASGAVADRPFKTVHSEGEDDAGDVNSYRAVFVEEPHWIFDGMLRFFDLCDLSLEEYIVEKKLCRCSVANPSIVDFIYMWLFVNFSIVFYISCVFVSFGFTPAHYKSELGICYMISMVCFCTILTQYEHLCTFFMLLREAFQGKTPDEEEEDIEPKMVSAPAFPSQYCIAKEVDRVLRGKGTKKCVLLLYEKTYEYLNSVKSRCYGYLAFYFCVLIPLRVLMQCAFIIPPEHSVQAYFSIIRVALYFRAVYIIIRHALLLHNICKAQRSGDLQIRLKD